MTDEAPVERQIKSFELKLKISGANLVQTETLLVETIQETEPRLVQLAGAVYHRYGDEVNFIDIRSDLVVYRSVSPVYVPKALENKGDQGPKALVQTEKGSISV